MDEYRERMFTGLWGEIYAARYLRGNGYKILSANYRTRFGEIDIVASDDSCIIFVEVKSRKEGMIAPPAESVIYAKQRRISAAARQYLDSFPTQLVPRFDIIEIYMGGDSTPNEIKHIKSAFETVR